MLISYQNQKRLRVMPRLRLSRRKNQAPLKMKSPLSRQSRKIQNNSSANRNRWASLQTVTPFHFKRLNLPDSQKAAFGASSLSLMSVSDFTLPREIFFMIISRLDKSHPLYYQTHYGV